MTYQLMGIAEADLEKLREDLGARVDRIRGKGEEGKDCDTIEITRGPACEDLSGSEEAVERIKGTSPARVDLLFDYPDFGEVRLRVSTRNGSIWFVNAVPEAVIDHVFEAFCRVKGI